MGLDGLGEKVVSICGSFRSTEQMDAARQTLTTRDLDCLMPSRDPNVTRGVQGCFDRIDAAEAVLVVNPGGYIGTSVLLDMGYAWTKAKPIYLTADHDDPAVMGLVTGVVDLEEQTSCQTTG